MEAEIEKEQLNSEKRHYENVLADWDRIQLEREMVEENIVDWKKTYHFLPETESKWLLKIFQSVEELKDYLFEGRQLLVEVEQIDASIRSYERDIETYSHELDLDRPDFYDLKKALITFEETKHERKQRLHQKEEIETEQKELLSQIAEVNKGIHHLFQLAKADNEEAFRQKAEYLRQNMMYSDKLTDLRRQMRQVVPDEAFIEESFHWFEQKTWAGYSEELLKNQDEALKAKIAAFRKKELEHATEIKALEKDQTYAELCHTYETQKAELNESAREWAVCQTSLLLLQETKEAYRREKLPNIIKEASGFFSTMTNGAYTTIDVTDSGTFMVRSSTGKVFYINELSRGTHEQLYLSIRLALTQAISVNEKLPIIIDDGLVNTDRARYISIMNVLKGISQTHQVIFLTCHPERLTEAGELQTVSLD